MNYAFEEFTHLANKPQRDKATLRYLCALVSELAYYHIPEFEFDAHRRAKLVVPSSGYRALIAIGASTNLTAAAGDFGFERIFVVVDRGVVAVGLDLGEELFVGFRGTAFLFDWRVNLSAKLTPISGICPTRLGVLLRPGVGRLHRGFAEEAVRIALRIAEEIGSSRTSSSRPVYLSGHSLGGAVAGIAEALLFHIGDLEQTHLFGAPRYADVGYYYSTASAPPLQVKREGDIIPSLPPRSWGYADHPNEFDTAGAQRSSFFGGALPYRLWQASLFLGQRFEPHFMESYRCELGVACGAKLANEPLIKV